MRERRCPKPRLTPRHGDADDVAVRNRHVLAFRPGRRRLVLRRWHVEGGDLAGEDGHHLDWHRHRPAEPAEPLAVVDDQLDLAIGRAHHALDPAERHIIVAQHRQHDEIADLHLLRKATVHDRLGRVVHRRVLPRCVAPFRPRCLGHSAPAPVARGRQRRPPAPESARCRRRGRPAPLPHRHACVILLWVFTRPAGRRLGAALFGACQGADPEGV